MAFDYKSFMRKVGYIDLRAYFDKYPPAPEIESHRSEGGRYLTGFAALHPDAIAKHVERFEMIRRLCGETARYALLRAATAAWFHDPMRVNFARSTPSHQLAMQLFLEHNESHFRAAEAAFTLDNSPNVAVFRSVNELPILVPNVEKAQRLAEHIKPFLDARIGTGQVVVDDWACQDSLLLSIYCEDAPRSQSIIVENQLDSRVHREVLRLKLLYHPTLKQIRVHAQGNTHSIIPEAVRGFISTYLPRNVVFSQDAGGRLYDFSQIAAGVSEFKPCRSPVLSAYVSSVSVQTSKGGGGKLRAGDLVHSGDFMDEALKFEVHPFMIREVRITFLLATRTRRVERKTVVLTLPNRTNLRSHVRDVILEEHLRAWGLIVTPGGARNDNYTIESLSA